MEKFLNGLALFFGFWDLGMALIYIVYGLRFGFTEPVALRALLHLVVSMLMFEIHDKRK